MRRLDSRQPTYSEHLYLNYPIFQRYSVIYGQGKRFIESLDRRDPTGNLVDTALRNPPGDIVQFYSPEQYPDTRRESRRDTIFSLLRSLRIDPQGEQFFKVPEPAFNLEELPASVENRNSFMRAYGERILASASMNYISKDEFSTNRLNISVFQGASTEALVEKKQKILDRHNAHNELLKAAFAGVHYPDTSTLTNWSAGLPQNTQQYAVQRTQSGSARSLMLYVSLHIEGNYLIAVTSFDNSTLNRTALVAALDAVKQLE